MNLETKEWLNCGKKVSEISFLLFEINKITQHYLGLTNIININ